MSSAESPTTATTTTITTTTTNNNNNSMIPPPVTTTPVGMTPEQNDHDDDASDAVETATKGEKGRFLPRVRILLSKDNEGVSFRVVRMMTVPCVHLSRCIFHHIMEMIFSIGSFSPSPTIRYPTHSCFLNL